MKTVLVIDSKRSARDVVARLLQKKEYEVLGVPVGQRYTYSTLTPAPDLILLNADSALSENNYTALTDACDYANGIGSPIILMTRNDDPATVGWAVTCGVSDFISLKVPNLDLFYERVAHWVDRRIDMSLEQTLDPRLRRALHITSSAMSNLCTSARCGESPPFSLIRQNSLTIISVLENSISMKALANRLGDIADLAIHLMRTASYSGWLAAACGYTGDDFMHTVIGGALHDTGKFLTPSNILYNTGRLEGEAWKIMQRHPEDSERILSLNSDIPGMVREIGGNHHEKIDGTGYPRGLSGAQIKRHVRIVAIADAYNARTSKRSYNTPEPKAVALEKLRYPEGHLDPELLKIFTDIILGKPSSLSAAR